MKHHPARRIAATLLAVVATLSCIPAASAANLTNLRCEYRDNPLGIDAEKPRLSWKIEVRDQKSEVRDQRPEVRGQKQTAYQVLVASTPELLAKDQGDLWDSKKVASDQSIQVEYGGQAVGIAAGLPLESARLAQRRPAVGLEPAGRLVDGPAQAGGLAGEVGQGGRRIVAVAAQGVHACGCAGTGDCLCEREG